MTAAKKSSQLPAVSEQSVDQVRQIPVEHLYVSPEETRKTIDQDALSELARSIELHGVQEALLVRPGMVVGVVESFEIVAGQRRWLASKLASQQCCPCVVREMSDAEAALRRVISNLQREGLSPMDEAETYGRLVALPGATIENIALQLAKSPSYVGRRLQLLKAIDPVRQALKAGAIEVGHALELAPLDEALQRQMLTRMQCGATLVEPEDIEDEDGQEGVCRFCGCTEGDACRLDGGVNCSWANEEKTVCTNPDCLAQFRKETGQQKSEWRKTHYSVVELRSEIAETAFRDLKDAPFPLIADLAPMPCTECPKRAGNSQLLFDDCAQDTCTDRPCFNRKVNAWIAAELDAAAAEKRKLLRLTTSWTSDKSKVRCTDYDGARAFKSEGECPHGEAGIWIDGRDAGRRATVCRKDDCKKHHGRSSGGGSARAEVSPAKQAERKALLASVKAEKSYRAELFSVIAKIPAAKIPAPTFAQLLLRVAIYAFDRSDSTKYGALAAATGIPSELFRYGTKDKLEKHVAGIPDQVKALFAYMAIEDQELTVHEHDVPGGGAMSKRRKLDLETLAEIVGVDWKALRNLHGAGAEKPAKESIAKSAKPAPAKKGAGKAAPKKQAAARKKMIGAVKAGLAKLSGGGKKAAAAKGATAKGSGVRGQGSAKTPKAPKAAKKAGAK